MFIVLTLRDIFEILNSFSKIPKSNTGDNIDYSVKQGDEVVNLIFNWILISK